MLSAYHFLITRPEPLATQWAQRLLNLGAKVSLQPMMEIQPLRTNAEKQAIVDCVLSLDEYSKAIFISQNAVEYAFGWIDQYWPQLPVDVDFLAIGEATAQVLRQKMTHLGNQPLRIDDACAMNSEALLQHEKLQSIEAEKIVIFKGEGGRDYLSKQLSQRGAQVNECALYRRHALRYDSLLEDFRQTQRQAIVAIHSGETLENLCAGLPGHVLPWLQQQTLLLPGERVAAMASRAGFKQCIVAKNATHDSMLDALQRGFT